MQTVARLWNGENSQRDFLREVFHLLFTGKRFADILIKTVCKNAENKEVLKCKKSMNF